MASCTSALTVGLTGCGLVLGLGGVFENQTISPAEKGASVRTLTGLPFIVVLIGLCLRSCVRASGGPKFDFERPSAHDRRFCTCPYCARHAPIYLSAMLGARHQLRAHRQPDLLGGFKAPIFGTPTAFVRDGSRS